MGETPVDKWYLICTISCFMKRDKDGYFVNEEYHNDRYSDTCPEVIDPDDFIEGTFEPSAYALRNREGDTCVNLAGWAYEVQYVYTDEISVVRAAERHVEVFGPTHIPFLVMHRIRDGLELPVRVHPSRIRRRH